MTGLQPYPAYRDSGVGWGAGGGGDSDWAAMWEGPVPCVSGPLVVRERSGRDVKLRVYIDTSVIGGCVDEEFSGPSRRLIERAERGEVTLVVSEATLRELERAPKAVRDVFDAIGAEKAQCPAEPPPSAGWTVHCPPPQIPLLYQMVNLHPPFG